MRSKRTPEKDDAVLSLKIQHALMELIEYVADQRAEPVDVAVHSMLEEIVEIERVRGMSSELELGAEPPPVRYTNHLSACPSMRSSREDRNV